VPFSRLMNFDDSISESNSSANMLYWLVPVTAAFFSIVAGGASNLVQAECIGVGMLVTVFMMFLRFLPSTISSAGRVVLSFLGSAVTGIVSLVALFAIATRLA
jgi:hypothetical protein